MNSNNVSQQNGQKKNPRSIPSREIQKAKEKTEKTVEAKTAKVEKMAKEKTRVQNHVTSSQKRRKDVTKDNIAKDIAEC